MITVKPTDDMCLINKYGRENCAVLIMREESREIGYVALAPFMSTYEILDMHLDIDKPLRRNEGESFAPLSSNELGLVEILLRAAGSFAINKDSFSLCIKDKSYFDLLSKFQFIQNGDFLVLYLSKLFSGGCSCGAKKEEN